MTHLDEMFSQVVPRRSFISTLVTLIFSYVEVNYLNVLFKVWSRRKACATVFAYSISYFVMNSFDVLPNFHSRGHFQATFWTFMIFNFRWVKFMCCRKLELHAVLYSHWSHTWSLICRCLLFWCIFNELGAGALKSQLSHRYLYTNGYFFLSLLSPRCTSLTCLFNRSFRLILYLHPS